MKKLIPFLMLVAGCGIINPPEPGPIVHNEILTWADSEDQRVVGYEIVTTNGSGWYPMQFGNVTNAIVTVTNPGPLVSFTAYGYDTNGVLSLPSNTVILTNL